MRDLALIGSILGTLLFASASPAGAQSMVDLNAAMGVNGALNGAASGATTALKVRETVMNHAPSSGGGGWADGGDTKAPSGGTGKAWATASSGSATSSGKSAWASPGSNSGGAAKGWASASGQTGKGWARRKDNGGASAHASASHAPTTSSSSSGGNGPSARDLATSGTSTSR
jgi:hypothetical protein